MIDPKALAKDSPIKEGFLQELKANGLSNDSLENYAKTMKTLEFLGKDLEDLTKRDLIKWSAKIQDKYAETTVSLYKALVKRYLRWLYNDELNDGEYPECVRWMKNKRNNGKKLPKEILSHKEIKQLTEITDNQRDRALIWVGYESGCRPGELLGLQNRDIEFDKFGAQILVDGKTGERRIRLVESVPDLKLWLSMHPDKENPKAWLWPGQKDHLKNSTWWRILQKYREKAGLSKPIHPHLLRHSRATHLAGQGLNESQLREIFGWTKNSDMPSIYVHLSGRDTDASILRLYGIDIRSSDDQLEMSTKKCPFCNHENSPNAIFCSECNGPLDALAVAQSDKRLRDQDKLIKKVIERLIERTPKVLEELLREEEIASDIHRLEESKAVA